MKLLAGLLVLSLTISFTFALPAQIPDNDAEVIGVRRRVPQKEVDETDVEPAFRNFDGVVDTGSGYPFFSSVPHNFGLNMGFFDSFEDILKRFRSRFLPATDLDDQSDEVGFPSLGLQPPKGGNTTSVVKVVDGHKVEINDTVYSKGDENSGAVFKVRVINIRPIDSDEEVAEGSVTSTKADDNDNSSSDKGSPEVLEKTNDDNEINGNIDDPEVKRSSA